MRCISSEDKAVADAKVDALLDGLLSSNASPQEVYSELQTTVTNKRIARSDDEFGSNQETIPDINVSPTFPDGSKKSQEEMSYERQAKFEHEQNVQNTNRFYFSNMKESEAVPPQDLCKYFSNDRRNKTEYEVKALKQAALSQRQASASDKVAYTRNKYVSSDGTVKEYRLVTKDMDIKEMLKRKVSSPVEALERLEKYITYCIGREFGFQNIKTIVVQGEVLILNGITFIPCIDTEYKNDKSIFPLDSIELIENGTIASFFNWTTLKKMTNLYSVCIDSMEFYRCEVGSSLGLGNRIGVSSLFKINKSLYSLTIGDNTVTRDSLDKEVSVPMKKNLATSKRFFNFSDGYKLNIYNGTNAIQSYMLSNLKSYAYNRGNKSTMQYVGGVAVRAGLAGVTGVLNLGVHLVGAVAKSFVDVLTGNNQDDISQ